MKLPMPGNMSCRLPARMKGFFFLGGIAIFSSVFAQENTGSAPMSNFPTVVAPTEKYAVEAMTGINSYDSGYGTGKFYSLRGIEVTDFGVLQAEAVRQARFGFSGNYGDLSLTHVLSPDYYTIVSAGSGESALFPDWRVDLAGYRKFGDQRQYVAGLATYYAKGNDPGRSDKGLILSGIYYAKDLVLEGGLRANVADPGAAFGPSEYVAATFGSDEKRAIIVRAERARETYQVLTSGTEKVDFISHTVSMQWRERITRDGLLIMGLGYYTNPSYAGASIDIGWRWSFR